MVGSDNIDSIMGTNPKIVIFSEYALQSPIAWDYIRPILRVNGGFAVYVRAYDQNIEKIKEAGGVARQNKIGIFSPACYQNEPENPKCKIKGTLDEKSPDRKLYLKPSCAYYDSVVVEKYLGEQWFCSEQEAIQAGFSKSPNCK